MNNLRTYGTTPFGVAVIHGGPGARGEMAPVARELESDWGVLEPLQSATSLEGQVNELRSLLEENGDLPIILIGFSWGAWLGYIVAASYPTIAKKLILIGSGPYEQEYAESIQETRLSRLGAEERTEYESILTQLNSPPAESKAKAFARLGALALKTDTYDPISGCPEQSTSAGGEPNIYHNVLQEAVDLRKSGKLLQLAKNITCPVVALHGDYDPHPANGVLEPLSVALKCFRFVLLQNCGHKPWIERHAIDSFFRVLRNELR